MSETTRYAIYLAPDPSSDVWRLGSAFLGYDAATAETVTHPAISGVSLADWSAHSAKPRLYGFHGTLKAPFRLAKGTTARLLTEDLGRFCEARRPFDLPELKIAVLDENEGRGFLAFVPDGPCQALAALERDVVLAFDRFRAPLTLQERQKRKPDDLSERQRDYLDRLGYPYILDEFRLHFSLTDRIVGAAMVAESVAETVRNQLGRVKLTVDALALFEQASASEPFRIAGRFTFGKS